MSEHLESQGAVKRDWITCDVPEPLNPPSAALTCQLLLLNPTSPPLRRQTDFLSAERWNVSGKTIRPYWKKIDDTGPNWLDLDLDAAIHKLGRVAEIFLGGKVFFFSSYSFSPCVSLCLSSMSVSIPFPFSLSLISESRQLERTLFSFARSIISLFATFCCDSWACIMILSCQVLCGVVRLHRFFFFFFFQW